MNYKESNKIIFKTIYHDSKIGKLTLTRVPHNKYPEGRTSLNGEDSYISGRVASKVLHHFEYMTIKGLTEMRFDIDFTSDVRNAIYDFPEAHDDRIKEEFSEFQKRDMFELNALVGKLVRMTTTVKVPNPDNSTELVEEELSRKMRVAGFSQTTMYDSIGNVYQGWTLHGLDGSTQRVIKSIKIEILEEKGQGGSNNA
ncbi:hypothetical protein CEW46_21510 [Bacillus cereus]|nr:hypothetical protein CEW46_21510 [Bacillus cereus]